MLVLRLGESCINVRDCWRSHVVAYVVMGVVVVASKSSPSAYSTFEAWFVEMTEVFRMTALTEMRKGTFCQISVYFILD